MPITRVYDLDGVQLVRLTKGEDDELTLEIADPGAEGEAMQWMVIRGGHSVTKLGQAILEFLKDHVRA